MLIQITGTTGSQPPYDVFLCNTGGTSCFFISGNTYIPPIIEINSENYFPNEEKLLIRTIDANGCIFEEIQNCSSGTTGTCVCNEYEAFIGHPYPLSFSYDPCCPSGGTVTQNLFLPIKFTFSSSTTPNIITGNPAIIRLVRGLCPCT
jgi:hypothetical protein